ncbi:DUF5301 domain-containing protein [Paenibacillus gallinarum]|uniref:DUF5301 domain-containing protein n=1 Tax=Paenibacillus gallinarum TaxID=2762232 RepID=A0ABR8T0P4_9BACL|nr:DUF5301 domain-containing protein [Paenibacillus gallinarum]MBD7969348.1 DUF5301 domain-containing protein [Paenibacillus gallinarum]
MKQRTFFMIFLFIIVSLVGVTIGVQYARTFTSFQYLVMRHISDTDEVTSLRISYTPRDEEWIEVTDQKQIQKIMDDLADIRLMRTKDIPSFDSMIYKMEIVGNKYDDRFTIVYGADNYLYIHTSGELKNHKSYAQGYKIISDNDPAEVLSHQ